MHDAKYRVMINLSLLPTPSQPCKYEAGRKKAQPCDFQCSKSHTRTKIHKHTHTPLIGLQGNANVHAMPLGTSSLKSTIAML